MKQPEIHLEQTFKKSLNALSLRYNLSNYNQFNLFRVMYKMKEEKNLHSRFIAFLLNPKGTHGQQMAFLELFLKEFGVDNFSLDGVTVLPDEVEKKEHDNIDILIINSSNQAIIIENKIFAGDSDKLDLEVDGSETNNHFHRYQMPRYYDIVVNSKNKDVVSMLYLTIDGKKPKCYKDFPKEVNWDALLLCKEYLKHIQHWLAECIAYLKEDSNLNRSIQQYKQAVLEFLNDYKLALELKDLSAQNIEEAYSFWENKNTEGVDKANLLLEQYIHVKWHTIHELFTLLRTQIETTFNVHDISEIDNEKITSLTHHNSKSKIVLTFIKDKISYYVCNDKKGFSIGVVKEEKSETDFEVLFNGNYSDFHFSNHDVFKLMNEENSNRIVKEIVEKLKEFSNR